MRFFVVVSAVVSFSTIECQAAEKAASVSTSSPTAAATPTVATPTAVVSPAVSAVSAASIAAAAAEAAKSTATPQSIAAAASAAASAAAAAATAAAIQINGVESRSLGIGDAKKLSVELRGLSNNSDGNNYCAPSGAIMYVDTLPSNGIVKVHFTKVPKQDKDNSLGCEDASDYSQPSTSTRNNQNTTSASTNLTPANASNNTTTSTVSSTTTTATVGGTTTTATAGTATTTETAGATKIVKIHKTYSVAAETVQTIPALAWGADTGVLVAPYKFHLDDHSLSGAASVGGYLGARWGVEGISNTVLAAAGIGVVPISKTVNGTPTTDNAASFTFAAGDIVSVTRTGLFQVGLLIGFDWTGNNQYKHEGKPWIALSFGSNLTQ